MCTSRNLRESFVAMMSAISLLAPFRGFAVSQNIVDTCLLAPVIIKSIFKQAKEIMSIFKSFKENFLPINRRILKRELEKQNVEFDKKLGYVDICF